MAVPYNLLSKVLQKYINRNKIKLKEFLKNGK